MGRGAKSLIFSLLKSTSVTKAASATDDASMKLGLPLALASETAAILVIGGLIVLMMFRRWVDLLYVSAFDLESQ